MLKSAWSGIHSSMAMAKRRLSLGIQAAGMPIVLPTHRLYLPKSSSMIFLQSNMLGSERAIDQRPRTQVSDRS